MEQITKSEFLDHLKGRTLGFLDYHNRGPAFLLNGPLFITEEEDLVIHYDDRWELYFIYFIHPNRSEAKVYVVYSGCRHLYGIGVGTITNGQYQHIEYNFTHIRDNRHFFEGLNKAMNESYALIQSYLN